MVELEPGLSVVVQQEASLAQQHRMGRPSDKARCWGVATPNIAHGLQASSAVSDAVPHSPVALAPEM